MVQRSKREYLEAIRGRYRRAGRRFKKRILDEFCAICGYHRKHAIRLLRTSRAKRRRKPGRPARYGEPERRVVERIWLAANRPCALRLKAALEVWLPSYQQEFGRLDRALKEQLARISARTLDRLLCPVRRRHGRRGKCGTRPGSLLRKQIPIKTEHADVHQPGVLEADTVAHCGSSLDGNFVWSLTLTDIFSGWTANAAVWNKGYAGIRDAIAAIEAHLPFPIRGFHSDNGGEFLNHHLIRYFEERQLPVSMSRGRPYHKDDTAHVEQKNYTHVRLLLGYARIERPELLDPINRLYEAWGLFNNYFSPCLKLLRKLKDGSAYRKTYDRPQTPYQRLMRCPQIPELMKTHLTEVACNLNPFRLRRLIDHQQAQILSQLR